MGLAAGFLREARAVASRPMETVALVLFPLLLVIAFACLTGTGLPRELPTAFVDEDNSAVSREVARALDAAPAIRLVAVADRQAARRAITDGAVYAAVVIPKDYARDIARGQGASIEAMVSSIFYVSASTIEVDLKATVSALSLGRLERVAARTGGGLSAAPFKVETFRVASSMQGNPAFSYQAYLSAAVIPAVLQLTAVFAFALTLCRELRDGTGAEWIGTAGGILPAIASKFAFWAIPVLAFFTGYVAWFAGWAGWHPVGLWWRWVLSTWLLAGAMSGVAMTMAALAPKWRLAMMLCSGFVAPILPYTGFSYPLASMDWGAGLVSQCIPLTWFIRAQAVDWTLGSGFAVWWLPASVLLGFALLPWLYAPAILAWRIRRAGRAS